MAALAVLFFEIAFLVGPYDLLGFRAVPRIVDDWALGLVARLSLYATLLVVELAAWKRWRPPT
jgi:hypothetical protein